MKITDKSADVMRRYANAAISHRPRRHARHVRNVNIRGAATVYPTSRYMARGLPFTCGASV